jgi:NAD(P)-dependent dehydrogenase (short-subunit alcohol dehydrogenase family)
MPTALITGASRGIGLEFARQYADLAWRVIGTCRDPRTATALGEIEGNIDVEALDIADHGQVQALAKSLKREDIDVLINNAGVHGPRPSRLGGIDYDAWAEVFRINTMGPMKVSEAFVEHIARSDQKKIVTITSRMGSIADNESGGAYPYRSSKAALNAVMRSLAADLKPRGVTVVVFHPGWVRTDMGGPSAPIKPERSVESMIKVVSRIKLSDSGKFLNYDGAKLAW